MKILAIETSCDDTGIAILEASDNPPLRSFGEATGGFSVLSNVIASQIEIGKKYGGVFPMMAKREHQRNLLPTFIKALKEADMLKIFNEFSMTKLSNIKNILEREPELYKKIIPFLKKYKKPDIDLISVTNGPGLEPCLWVGVNFAKCLSYFWDIPIVPVNHIESHILVNTLKNPDIELPAIALVVSGGHTQLIFIKKIGNYKILGETRDDAAGECCDKCAKILGLGYPGGPIIAALAAKSETRNSKSEIKLPRPMINTKDYDFSFSGLKTAVLYAWKKNSEQNSEFLVSRQKTYQIAFAKEIQQAIIDVLIKKTMKAVKDFNAKTLILGGGVSANTELRKQFKNKLEAEHDGFLPFGKKPYQIKLIVPEPNLSTDNGLMTAITGFYHKKNTVDWKKIQANGNLRIGE